MNEYTPDTRELLKNRIVFLTGQIQKYKQNIQNDEQEIKRLSAVYTDRYTSKDVYFPETENPWAI